MSLNLNGFAVIGAIAANADVFATIKADIDKQASALVMKSLKARSIDVAAVRDIYRALGKESFGLIADEMTGAQIKTLLTKIDPHRAEIKSETGLWRRQLLDVLADGSQEAAPKLAPVKKTAVKSTGTKKSSKVRAGSPADQFAQGYKSAGRKRSR